MCRARVQDARVAGGASHRLRRPSATQAKTNRENIFISVQSRAVTRIEPPQPRVIHVRVTELGKTGACSPGALSFMHLEQPLADARVDVRGDDALNLGALARVRVFFVPRHRHPV